MFLLKSLYFIINVSTLIFPPQNHFLYPKFRKYETKKILFFSTVLCRISPYIKIYQTKKMYLITWKCSRIEDVLAKRKWYKQKHCYQKSTSNYDTGCFRPENRKGNNLKMFVKLATIVYDI